MKKSKIHEEVVVDQNGEIKSQKSVSVYESKKDDFYVKLYLENISYLKDLTKAEILVLFALTKYITYKNTVHITVGIKDKIGATYDLTAGTIRKCISGLHSKKWLINTSRGTYIINPEFIGKGSWGNISELRGQLHEVNDFIHRK